MTKTVNNISNELNYCKWMKAVTIYISACKTE